MMPRPARTPLVYTGLVLVGAAVLLAGLWFIFPPAALIVGGVSAVGLGIVGIGARNTP